MVPYFIIVLGPDGQAKNGFMEELAQTLCARGMETALMLDEPAQPPPVARISLSGQGMRISTSRPRGLGMEEIAGLYLGSASLVLSALELPGKAAIEFCPQGSPRHLDWPGLKAVAGADTNGKPPAFALDDLTGLARLLAKNVAPKKPAKVRMFVDGKRLPAKYFVQHFVAGGVRGLLSPLKGYNLGKPLAVFVDPED